MDNQKAIREAGLIFYRDEVITIETSLVKSTLPQRPVTFILIKLYFQT